MWAIYVNTKMYVTVMPTCMACHSPLYMSPPNQSFWTLCFTIPKAKYKQKIIQNPQPATNFCTTKAAITPDGITISLIVSFADYRNCTRDKDYIEQSVLLKQKFVKKDFLEPLIEQAFTLHFIFVRSPHSPLRYTGLHWATSPVCDLIQCEIQKYKTSIDQALTILLEDQHLKSTLPPKSRAFQIPLPEGNFLDLRSRNPCTQ